MFLGYERTAIHSDKLGEILNLPLCLVGSVSSPVLTHSQSSTQCFPHMWRPSLRHDHRYEEAQTRSTTRGSGHLWGHQMGRDLSSGLPCHRSGIAGNGWAHSQAREAGDTADIISSISKTSAYLNVHYMN